MPGIAAYTSFTSAYLPRARVLAQTLKSLHPDWTLHALLADAPPAGLDIAAGFAPFDRVVRADALGIADFPGWMFRHNLVEACTAVKAPMLERLLAEGARKVIYLDPDIALFDRLTGIAARLDHASVVLTPHQLAANAEAAAIADNELTSLRYGIYNLGFLGVANDATGRRFARWWRGMTARACYDDVAAGIFTDQKYCDLVPALFERVHVERDPGCNVASWNLSRRHLHFGAGGDLLANDSTLKFYHFTKIDGVGEVMTERYAQDSLAVYELVNWYRRQVVAQAEASPQWPWHYGVFSDGRPITPEMRLLWRARPDLQARWADPFAVGDDSFIDWLERQRPSSDCSA